MSQLADICDAVIRDLKDNVAGLDGATEHPYEAWDPEHLIADGARHLAVFPIVEEQDLERRAIGAHTLTQSFVILFWEGSDTEATRLVADPEGAKAMLDVQQDVRDRLLLPTWNAEYGQTTFPETTSLVRWFRTTVTFSVDP